MTDDFKWAGSEAWDAKAVSGLFQQAAAAGRDSLDSAELAALASRLGIVLDGEAKAEAAELRVSLHWTREFGMVLSAGLGGLDPAAMAATFRKDRAVVHAAVDLVDAEEFLALVRRTFVYHRLVAQAGAAAVDPHLASLFGRLIQLGTADLGDRHLHCLEMTVVAAGQRLAACGAVCTFGAPPAQRLARPVHKIDKLIHPGSIGIIGVSATSMNFGRIILRNLLGSGCEKDRLTIIRPGETEIDGVKCVESVGALDGKLDLLIVAVAASAVYDLVDEIIRSDSVEAVMLIPGSLGETKASREPAAALAERINAAHGKEGGGPVFLGANCLGVVSHAGRYDSWFIPLERLPKVQKRERRNSVMLSQSGAFMITRISRNPWLDPLYMVALGNQTDLTHGDMLSFFAELPGIDAIGVYVEGFKDLDGLAFAKAVRQATLNGKQVVVYKSGKSTAGAAGVMGHTASIAGELTLFESVVRQAGAMVADDLDSFDDLFYLAGELHGKTIGGNRIGAISGAGFEAVGIADSIVSDTFSLEVASLGDDTCRAVQDILVAKRLDALVEVRNPIDINPGADDEAHLQITEAFLADPNVDAVVVGLDPTAPAVAALAESKLRPGFDISHPKSSVNVMPPAVRRNDKPIIAIIDGGSLYDAMAGKLMDQGVCVFRNCVRGTKALVRYVEARLQADAIRKRANRDA